VLVAGQVFLHPGPFEIVQHLNLRCGDCEFVDATFAIVNLDGMNGFLSSRHC